MVTPTVKKKKNNEHQESKRQTTGQGGLDDVMVDVCPLRKRMMTVC
jgi:hypothetical protein